MSTERACLWTAVSDFSCLLINFANSLGPYQNLQNVGPDLDPTFVTLIVIVIFYKETLKKEKSADNDKTPKKSKLSGSKEHRDCSLYIKVCI